MGKGLEEGRIGSGLRELKLVAKAQDPILYGAVSDEWVAGDGNAASVAMATGRFYDEIAMRAYLYDLISPDDPRAIRAVSLIGGLIGDPSARSRSLPLEELASSGRFDAGIPSRRLASDCVVVLREAEKRLEAIGNKELMRTARFAADYVERSDVSSMSWGRKVAPVLERAWLAVPELGARAAPMIGSVVDRVVLADRLAERCRGASRRESVDAR
jgi:hypothetical protein